MARPPSPQPRVEFKARLPRELLDKLNLISRDPFTDRLRYGDRNGYVEAALVAYFAEHFPDRKEKA